MARRDLIALTLDDLAAMTNRGTVKRARREWDEGTPSCAFDETTDGEVIVTWSDGIVCRFPAGKTIHDSVCSSGFAGISRHVVRSVIAYQHRASAEPEVVPSNSDRTPPPPISGSPFDPGAFSDEDLVARFRAPAIAKARQRFNEGVLVELTRGSKPTARFLDNRCTVRFLVPGDLRYVTADCSESLLSLFVPLAVWSFRELPADRAAGLISRQAKALATPTRWLDDLETSLATLCLEGTSGVAAAYVQRLLRLETALRENELVWPAELVADLVQQLEMYSKRDARFDPLEVVALVGEAVARLRAIRNGTNSIPQLYIRGSRSNRATEIAGGRLIGLGLGMRAGRSVTTLGAYLQDSDTGTLCVVERTFADPSAESGAEPKAYALLADTIIARGISIGGLAAAQLLLKSGKRTPSGQLILPRGAIAMTANPQSYQWEHLRPPVAVENFVALAARLDAIPPSYLRPRGRTENFHVCPATFIEAVEFDEARQRMSAVLVDAAGGRARLSHPFRSRGREGFEALARALETRANQIRFVSGHVTTSPRGIVVAPTALVFETDGQRTALLPWQGEVRSTHAPSRVAANPGEVSRRHTENARPPLDAFIQHLEFELSELLLCGLQRSDDRAAVTWTELFETAREFGFALLSTPIGALSEEFRRKPKVLHWDASRASALLAELCMIVRIAADDLVT